MLMASLEVVRDVIRLHCRVRLLRLPSDFSEAN